MIKVINKNMDIEKNTYKLSLQGDGISVHDKVISEEVARKIIFLIMGGETSGNDVHYNTIIPEQNFGGTTLTPKRFMSDKKPSSEIERLTCLAYYLLKYRNKTAFKTLDLNKLNRDAAQPEFSNATVFARNAVQAEYLSKAGGGSKQITAFGEMVVEALPDREKVKKVIEDQRSSRRRTSKKSHTSP